jgi:peptide deformylase
MEFKVIPNEQTPKTCHFTFEIIKDYIEEHRDEFQAFLEYAKTRNDAVGLAANQLALDGKRFMRRAFVLRDMVTREWRLVIDPQITKYSGIKEIKGEGCLTWKGRTIVAERHRAVEVSYYDFDGNYYTGEIYKGFDAQIWQHEVNHLNGIEEDVRDSFTEPAPIMVERNDLCPCGSGKKYKKCCLLLI